MLLTLTATAAEDIGFVATDLGFLLHKHPDKVARFELSAGLAHVFYPEASAGQCTVALLLEVDPIALVRGKGAGRGVGGDGFALGQYVNDRPYAASSLLAVALGRVFRTAMSGRCDDRPELPSRALPLRIHLPALPCRGGVAVARRLFGPLGWTIDAQPVPLDPAIPEWGDSRYLDLRLAGTLRVADAINQLYVMLPVLDDAKHYWVSTDEVDKLVRAGQGWLAEHPERDLITGRYLAHQRSLVSTATARLAEVDDTGPEGLDNAVAQDGAEATARIPLAKLRREAVLAALASTGAKTVLDLGCGDGTLLAALLADPVYVKVVGVDVSHRALQIAARRLHLDTLAERQLARIELRQSSLTYRDARNAGFDAAVLMEVVEHVDPARLPALERAVFGYARPRTVIVTTPNAEYNVRYPDLSGGAMRHPDHRFEWTRAEFAAWAASVAQRFGYAARHAPVGENDAEVGSPTQLALFSRGEDA